MMRVLAGMVGGDEGADGRPRSGRAGRSCSRSPSPPLLDPHSAMTYGQAGRGSPVLLHRCPFSNCCHSTPSHAPFTDPPAPFDAPYSPIRPYEHPYRGVADYHDTPFPTAHPAAPDSCPRTRSLYQEGVTEWLAQDASTPPASPSFAQLPRRQRNMRTKGFDMLLKFLVRLVESPDTRTHEQLTRKAQELETKVFQEAQHKTEKEYLSLIVVKLASVLQELKRTQELCPALDHLYLSCTQPQAHHLA